MSPPIYSKQDSASNSSHNSNRPIKKMKQQQSSNHSHTYNNPLVIEDDGGQQDAPPRKDKDKDKHKKQHQKNKKKRSLNEDSEAGGSSSKARTSTSLARNKSAAGVDGEAENDEDDEEADSRKHPHRRAQDEEDEADDEHDSSKQPKKKLKKSATISSPVLTTTAPPTPIIKNKTNRLVLRLPRSKGFGPSTTNKPTIKNPSPIRNTVKHPGSLPRTVTSSPQSSSELSEVNLPEDAIPSFGLTEPQASVHFAYETDSSDGYSDLLNDDEDDLLEAEEAYLIADKLQRQGRHSRRGTTSPGAKRTSEDGAHSDADSMDLIHDAHNEHFPIDTDSVFLEIAQLRDGTSTSEAEAGDSAREIAVTWSGAEDNDMLDDLDEFLGITTDDAAALRGFHNQHESSTASGPATANAAGGTTDNEIDDGKTMRFEDFLGQDDGSDTSSSTEEESSSEEEEEHSVAATNTDTAAEDENLETTGDVVKEGGFVFYKSAYDDDETESEDERPADMEDDGGDTTDTLDDTDHLGMIRFGIEAAESDDEDAEEVLANAIRDRNLTDAHNMGLSVSIEALAEQPEAVVLKTARSLGISTDMAAKILTSVGMSILMSSNGGPRDVFIEPRPSTSSSKDQHLVEAHQNAVAGPSTLQPVASTSATGTNTGATAGQSSIPPPQKKTFEPVLGDFAPAGEADLCVVVGATDMPAPSPFSARKRKTRSSTRNFASPNGRGQSVASTISTQSAASGRYDSSEEPHYNLILNIDDLVDPSMLPTGMSSVSEGEEEDIDDAASVSTALGGVPSTSAGVGDVSRWNRIPIGAFRSQNPNAFTSFASAVFSGTMDAAAAHDLSFHGGVTISDANRDSNNRHNRYIPVSPVLFPVGQTFKAIQAVKSRKERRKEKKSRDGRSGHGHEHVKKIKSEKAHSRSHSSSRRSSNSNDRLLQLPQQHQNSLPSDGLTHHVSPLFAGVTSGLSIPPLAL